MTSASSSISSHPITMIHTTCSYNQQQPHFILQNPICVFPSRSYISSRSVLTFARRQKKSVSPVTSNIKKKKQNLPQTNVGEDDDLDEDAFEALFRQLEEDLKNDDPSVLDGDEEISEEDLALLERELEEALGDEELQRAFNSTVDESEIETGKEGVDDEEEEDYDDEEEKQVVLKNWQTRRLAYALKNGRRKTSIKNLAAETCLDRAFVLKLLRDPPPNLLLMSAALPDLPAPTVLEPESKRVENVASEEDVASGDAVEHDKPNSKAKTPVHVMHSSWSAQKRIKKVQLETLERVYRRTKRPTNAMISNIVHVTNLPRKRVVKWFEDKRTEDEVPDRRVPYERLETVISS